jgi:ABC-type antimicrobial peptide transport system permease subunit
LPGAPARCREDAGGSGQVSRLVAILVGRLLASWLVGVSGTGRIALTSAALVLFVTALFASWFPVYRAGRADPLETLNAE